MAQLLKEATLTGRLASLARHPLNAKRRSKMDRRISEKLVKKVNIPLYKALTGKKVKGKTFADVAGGASGYVGEALSGRPLGGLQKKMVGRGISRLLADNPELALGQAIPLPYVTPALALGKKGLYKAVGAKTPAQVRLGMSARKTRQALGGAAVGGAGLVGAKSVAGKEKEAQVFGFSDEITKIAQDQSSRKAHKPATYKRTHTGQRTPNVHKAWKYTRPQ